MKLINALFNGRHCIVNKEIVVETSLESLCHICNSKNEIIEKVNLLIEKAFNEHDIDLRNKVLLKNVNNTM